MNKIVKIYSLQFLLTAAVLCTIPIGGEYFYIPVIAGVIASACFYYTVKETIKKCEEVKAYILKKHEEERKFYTDIIHSAEMISKENKNRIDTLEKTINSISKEIEKNNNVLANKIADSISKAEKNMTEQHDDINKTNGQLYAEVREFKDNYNKVSKNNLKMISNEFKHYNSKMRDEINSDNEKLLETIRETNQKNEVNSNYNFSQLIKIFKGNIDYVKEMLESKAQENTMIMSGSFRKLIDNTVNIKKKLDDMKAVTAESIHEACESIKSGNSFENNKLIDSLENAEKNLYLQLSKIVLDTNNSEIVEDDDNTELEVSADINNNIENSFDEDNEDLPYSEGGVDYFTNNKLVRHIDEDGSITEFEYDGEEIKQSTTRKNGQIIKQCSYVNGVLTDGKLFEDGQVKEEYMYDENGEIITK